MSYDWCIAGVVVNGCNRCRHAVCGSLKAAVCHFDNCCWTDLNSSEFLFSLRRGRYDNSSVNLCISCFLWTCLSDHLCVPVWASKPMCVVSLCTEVPLLPASLQQGVVYLLQMNMRLFFWRQINPFVFILLTENVYERPEDYTNMMTGWIAYWQLFCTWHWCWWKSKLIVWMGQSSRQEVDVCLCIKENAEKVLFLCSVFS